uniref:Uncharacterized protein n=1 Tax=Panagrolaimus sp. ES5 TaxID=591445 RepID=A0AC34F2R0_9BILA
MSSAQSPSSQLQQQRRRRRSTATGSSSSKIGENLYSPSAARKHMKNLLITTIDEIADTLKQIPRSTETSSKPAATEVSVETNESKEKSPKSQQQKKQEKLCAAVALCAAATMIPPSSSTLTKTTPCCNKQLRRRCDGPCNRKLNIRDLTSIGLCEHVSCEECLENAPRIEANFGGLGCPNVKCYRLDRASLCPDKKQRVETNNALTSAPAASETSSNTYLITISIKTKKK